MFYMHIAEYACPIPPSHTSVLPVAKIVHSLLIETTGKTYFFLSKSWKICLIFVHN